jgi:SMODS and SLOG-associating 2TM effector domain 1
MGPAWETGAPGGDGRIPFTFRIGVTGHRDLADPDGLRVAIRKALRGLIELLPVAPAAGLTPVVVSALAEGADRLVAEEILADPAARLEVSLPLSPADYEEDFKTEASKEEFRLLLARASAIWHAQTTEDRNEAYEQAGRTMVDRCDALIAVWDGEDPRGQGGTADIVAYAQENGVPIAWVNTQGNPEPTYAHSYNQDSRVKVLTKAADKLRTYNARVIDSEKFDKRIQDLRDELMPDVASEIPIDPLGLSREKVADWVFPYYVRADILALHYQRWFLGLSQLIFALASAAVAVVALQVTIWPSQDWVVGLEVLCLIGLLIILGMNRRLRLQDQWISSRFLAERLRSSYFLALAGTGDQRGRSPRIAFFSDSSEAWIERALGEVIACRPHLDAASAPLEVLRDYLRRHWIEGQISYQTKTSGQLRASGRQLAGLTKILFFVTLIAALVHSSGDSIVTLPEGWKNALVVVSITFPAIGAALHGYGAQRQFRRHSERYRTMAGVLDQARADMARATTIDQVQDVARETERIMREENSDWFGVMRFHDIELIT